MNGTLAAGAIAFVLIALAGRLHPTPYDNYVLLADAFRHGRVWIDWPGAYIDALSYAGRYYVIEAPMPGILLLPFVAIWGTAANQSLLAAILGAVAVGSGWDIARRIGVSVSARLWLCGFLLFGTDLFWCAMYGDVWFIAHVASAAFTLLALGEIMGGKRAWLVAIYAGCAVESRFSLVLALPVYAVWLALECEPQERVRRLAAFAGGLVPFAIFWVWYNEARWGQPYDIGYTAWYHQDQVGEPTGSPFRLEYVPNQLYSFFVRFPDVVAQAPYLIPTNNGIALTWTSPALLLALFARRPRNAVIALWAATLLIFLPNVAYYVNGFAQFGMRHALDFEPFLFVLMLLAAKDGWRPIWTALCGWSMLAGAWGIWFWKTYNRPL
jgi:hypothetical protein